MAFLQEMSRSPIKCMMHGRHEDRYPQAYGFEAHLVLDPLDEVCCVTTEPQAETLFSANSHEQRDPLLTRENQWSAGVIPAFDGKSEIQRSLFVGLER
jgi:hypothetical protein